ncbi:uncharacterized protein N0V96_000314 [Colletotrichum fioriniae]|uniref:uncharacterized protein n=1 Tax=Colletotrichum fioriniae TaxID=710243 RepID=UPI0032D9CC4B|nr:hypothetical protein N0V96_000314 [Colletotrichum fioriniae]
MSGQGYEYKSSGTNSESARISRHIKERKADQLISSDGSYYYSNPNGSTYYNDGNGGSTYTSSSGERSSSGYGGGSSSSSGKK